MIQTTSRELPRAHASCHRVNRSFEYSTSINEFASLSLPSRASSCYGTTCSVLVCRCWGTLTLVIRCWHHVHQCDNVSCRENHRVVLTASMEKTLVITKEQISTWRIYAKQIDIISEQRNPPDYMLHSAYSTRLFAFTNLLHWFSVCLRLWSSNLRTTHLFFSATYVYGYIGSYIVYTPLLQGGTSALLNTNDAENFIMDYIYAWSEGYGGISCTRVVHYTGMSRVLLLSVERGVRPFKAVKAQWLTGYMWASLATAFSSSSSTHVYGREPDVVGVCLLLIKQTIRAPLPLQMDGFFADVSSVLRELTASHCVQASTQNGSVQISVAVVQWEALQSHVRLDECIIRVIRELNMRIGIDQQRGVILEQFNLGSYSEFLGWKKKNVEWWTAS